MKVAIIGSRSLSVNNLEKYIPDGITEIVTGGAKGIDSCAKEYAQSQGIKLTVFLPDYKSYGKAAPLKRNLQIIDYADRVIAFWDGISSGTDHVIRNCNDRNKEIVVHIVK